MNEKLFTICVFTENKVGLLNRISGIFTRRKMNILSLTTSESEIKDVYRFTITIKQPLSEVIKVTKVIEKQVGVLKAFYYEEDNGIFREIALYKLPIEFATPENIEKYVHAYGARVIDQEPEFIIIEKTGTERDTQVLFDLLKPFHIMGFVRSGRVALARSLPQLRNYLDQLHLDSFEEVSLLN
ncbi:MAG: acetolactate synthase small subunit [Cytophagales bacterium]|nr:acetolactate synthase small subunit [Cytophagales bacterium]MDW8384349.1 acetolactate synthase small subunit [Flammeovirgaceae bacterium]